MKLHEIINEAEEVVYVTDCHRDEIEVLINPTMDELRDIAKADDYHSVRVMRFGDTVYAFPASKSTHDFIAIQLDLPWKTLTNQNAAQLTWTCNGLKSSTGALQTPITDWGRKEKRPLSEAFDAPYSFASVSKADEREVYKFNTNNGEHYRVHFKMRKILSKKLAWVGFETYDGETTITGKGDAFRVFATVIAILKEFTSRNAPDMLSFSGKGGTRQKLYDVFARKISVALPDYTLVRAVDDRANREYIFSKNNK